MASGATITGIFGGLGGGEDFCDFEFCSYLNL